MQTLSIDFVDSSAPALTPVELLEDEPASVVPEARPDRPGRGDRPHIKALSDVLTRTAVIEVILQTEFSGRGRGIHSKIASSVHPIPAELVARLRFIGAVRNKAVFEPDFDIPHRAEFLAGCEQAACELLLHSRHRRAPVRPSRGPGPWLMQGLEALANAFSLNRPNALAR